MFPGSAGAPISVSGSGAPARARQRAGERGRRDDRMAGKAGDYEINTAVWLDELSRAAGQRVTWPTLRCQLGRAPRTAWMRSG